MAFGRVHAGPPFRTDDPVPVALGHYELYTAAIGTHVKGDTSGALPGVELTYGLIPNGQLQVGGEAAFDSPVLFSAGRGLQNASDSNLFSWYLGWELTY